MDYRETLGLATEVMDCGWYTLSIAKNSLQVNGFRLPPGGKSEMDLAPAFLQKWGTRQLVASPFVTERCTGCRLCVDNCPVRTISQVEGVARINLSGCIRCYCCHELCPEQAIVLRRPWLRQVLGRLGQ